MPTLGFANFDARDKLASLLPGLVALWAESVGNPGICVAVLDGPVDLGHPSFSGARLTTKELLVSSVADQGPASVHGTHVASVIFGHHSGPIRGIAPGCRGLIIRKRPTITRTNLWGKVPRVVLRARTRNLGPEIRCCHLWLKSSFKRGGWLETKWPSVIQ